MAFKCRDFAIIAYEGMRTRLSYLEAVENSVDKAIRVINNVYLSASGSVRCSDLNKHVRRFDYNMTNEKVLDYARHGTEALDYARCDIEIAIRKDWSSGGMIQIISIFLHGTYPPSQIPPSSQIMYYLPRNPVISFWLLHYRFFPRTGSCTFAEWLLLRALGFSWCFSLVDACDWVYLMLLLPFLLGDGGFDVPEELRFVFVLRFVIYI